MQWIVHLVLLHTKLQAIGCSACIVRSLHVLNFAMQSVDVYVRSKSDSLSNAQLMSRSGELHLPRPQRAASSAAQLRTPPPSHSSSAARLGSSVGVGAGSPFGGGAGAGKAVGTPVPASNRLNKILNAPMHAVATLQESRWGGVLTLVGGLCGCISGCCTSVMISS